MWIKWCPSPWIMQCLWTFFCYPALLSLAFTRTHFFLLTHPSFPLHTLTRCLSHTLTPPLLTLYLSLSLWHCWILTRFVDVLRGGWNQKQVMCCVDEATHSLSTINQKEGEADWRVDYLFETLCVCLMEFICVFLHTPSELCTFVGLTL